MPAHWREAGRADLPAIGEIAERIHPDLPERAVVLAEKMRLYPSGCRVLVSGTAIVGYGIAHPWTLHQIPPLDDFLRKLPREADCLYVHDVAVRPEYRGGALVSYMATIATLARATGIVSLALVSVYGTTALWERSGFRETAGDMALRAKLASYGESAKYMICDLDHARDFQT
jgi:GNAT superfamily N-acetyltransferase